MIEVDAKLIEGELSPEAPDLEAVEPFHLQPSSP
jgi:hypothetical protein